MEETIAVSAYLLVWALLTIKAFDIAQSLRIAINNGDTCLLYTSPSPRDYAASRMPSSA